MGKSAALGAVGDPKNLNQFAPRKTQREANLVRKMCLPLFRPATGENERQGKMSNTVEIFKQVVGPPDFVVSAQFQRAGGGALRFENCTHGALAHDEWAEKAAGGARANIISIVPQPGCHWKASPKTSIGQLNAAGARTRGIETGRGGGTQSCGKAGHFGGFVFAHPWEPTGGGKQRFFEFAPRGAACAARKAARWAPGGQPALLSSTPSWWGPCRAQASALPKSHRKPPTQCRSLPVNAVAHFCHAEMHDFRHHA